MRMYSRNIQLCTPFLDLTYRDGDKFRRMSASFLKTDCPMTPHVIDVTQDDFESVVLQGSQQTPVLVDFWADWVCAVQTTRPRIGITGRRVPRGLLAGES